MRRKCGRRQGQQPLLLLLLPPLSFMSPKEEGETEKKRETPKEFQALMHLPLREGGRGRGERG